MPKKKIEKFCKQCKNKYIGISTSKFCSLKCAGNNKKIRINTPCINCNKAVERKLSVAKKYPLAYCSDNCRSEHLKTLTGNKNPNYKRINFKCNGCNQISKVKPYKAKSKLYCSQNCYHKYYIQPNGKKSPHYKKIEKECYECKIKIFRTPSQIKKSSNHFCSQKCYHKSNIQQRSISFYKHTCIICNKIFKSKFKKNNQKHIYCSKIFDILPIAKARGF